jgi:hypothetical protein
MTKIGEEYRLDGCRAWICELGVIGFAEVQRGEPMTKDEAINWIINLSADIGKAEHRDLWHYEQALSEIRKMLESAQPEIPPYVAEIEAEYKRWVNVPYIRKPLAKALYEVWKKHDREDVERRTDDEDGWLLEQGCTAWMPLPEPCKEADHE